MRGRKKCAWAGNVSSGEKREKVQRACDATGTERRESTGMRRRAWEERVRRGRRRGGGQGEEAGDASREEGGAGKAWREARGSGERGDGRGREIEGETAGDPSALGSMGGTSKSKDGRRVERARQPAWVRPKEAKGLRVREREPGRGRRWSGADEENKGAETNAAHLASGETARRK